MAFRAFTVKQLVVGFAVVGFVMAWGTHAERDVVVAQNRTPIKVTRIFTGPDGQTHSEVVDIKLTSSRGATDLSEMVNVKGLQFRRTLPNFFSDWHQAPRRQYIVTLSGRGEVELTGGRKIPLTPGHILLAEDTTGKGHISRGVGSDDRISLIIPLAER